MDNSCPAVVLNVVEHYAMYRMLGGFEGEARPRLSRWCATVKFSVIIRSGSGVWPASSSAPSAP